MTANQRFGFVLVGLVFVLAGVVLAACGWVYDAASLKGQGVMAVLAGLCWLILTAFVANRSSSKTEQPESRRH